MAQLVLYGAKHIDDGFILSQAQSHSNTTARVIGAALAVVALCSWQPASAQLKVSDSIIEMSASESQTTLQMSNTGAQPMQVSITLNAVVAPGLSGPSNEVTKPVSAEIMRIEPSDFEIPPNQSITVNVHRSANQLNEDEIYRMLVKPSSKLPQNGMNIHLSYDLLLMVRPDNSLPVIKLKTTNDGIALVNQGNSNALLSTLQMCDELIGSCESLPNLRLYTRQIFPLPVPEAFNLQHTVIKTTQTYRSHGDQIDYRVPTVTVSR